MEYLELLYGVWLAGTAVVPINAKLHWKEATVIIEDSQPKAVFVGDANDRTELSRIAAVASVDERRLLAAARDQTNISAPAPRDDRDLAWLFYTSGTTGRPKGVMLSHGNLIAMSLTYFNDVDEVHSTDAAQNPPRSCRLSANCVGR